MQQQKNWYTQKYKHTHTHGHILTAALSEMCWDGLAILGGLEVWPCAIGGARGVGETRRWRATDRWVGVHGI